MNPLLATGLFGANNAIENNSISDLASVEQALSENPDFAAEFAGLWQQLAEISGKEQPLGLAALKELDPALHDSLQLQHGQQPALLATGNQVFPQLSLPNILASSEHPVLNTAGQGNTQNANQPVLPGLNQAALQAGLSQNDVMNSAVNNSTSLSEQGVQEQLDQGMLQQLAGLKPIVNEVDGRAVTATLMQELQNTKISEQVSDKANLTAINAVNTGLSPLVSKTEQPVYQLPRIDVPVNQPEWSRSVGDRLMLMVNNKVQSAHILLNPPELGPIEVRVNMNQDQASVHFVSNHAAVRDAIEEAFPRLREMFAQNGLSLADANVSQQSAQQGRNFSHEQSDTRFTQSQQGTEHDDVEQPQLQLVDAGLIDHYV